MNKIQCSIAFVVGMALYVAGYYIGAGDVRVDLVKAERQIADYVAVECAGSATTTGDNSAAVTGSGNTITIKNSGHLASPTPTDVDFQAAIDGRPVSNFALHKISALPDFVVRKNSAGRCEGDINQKLTYERETALLLAIQKCQSTEPK